MPIARSISHRPRSGVRHPHATERVRLTRAQWTPGVGLPERRRPRRMRHGDVSAGADLANMVSPVATITASYDDVFNRDARTHRGSLGLTVGF